MVRILLVLLLLAACALALALLRDRSGHRVRRISRLRSAFLHGAVLAVPCRPANDREVVVGRGLLRLRLPGRWVEDGVDSLSFHDRTSDAWTLRLALQTSGSSEPGGEQELARVLGAPAVEQERSIEALPNGNLLMKWLEARRDAGRELAVYCWGLGRPLSAQELRSAVFGLAVVMSRAEDVVVRSDLVALEREIRAAELS